MRNLQAHTWPVFRYVPVFRLLIPFLSGLLLNIFYNEIYLVVMAVFLLVVMFIANILLPQKQWINGMKYQTMFLLSGFYVTDLNREIKWKHHFSKFKGDALVVVINDIPDEKPKTIKVTVNVIEVDSGNRGNRVEGKLLLYLKKDSASLKLKYGDKLLLPYSIEEIPELSAIAHLAIIAYLLGVPTDSIAIKIAQMLHPEEKDKDDQGDK